MKRIRDYISTLFASLKPLAVVAVCILVIGANAAPALAFGGSNSKPSKGLEQMSEVQKRSEQMISKPGSPADSAKSTIEKASNGLNGVQGRASKDKMISPRDVSEPSTIEENIEEALEDIKP